MFCHIQHRSLEYPVYPHNIYLSKLNYRKWIKIRLSNKHISTSVTGGVTCMQIDKTFQSYLLTGSGDSSLHIYNLDEHAKVIASIPKAKAHSASITQVQWYPVDAGLFTSSSLDSTLKVWDANTLEEACVFRLDVPVQNHVMPLVGNSSHCLIAAGLDAFQLRLCDIRTGSSTHTLSGHKAPAHCLSWSPRDDYVLVSGSLDHSIRVWDIRRAQSCLKTVETAHEGPLLGLSFTSDGLHLITKGKDDLIKKWNTHSWSFDTFDTKIHSKKPQSNSLLITCMKQCNPPLVFIPDYKNILVFELHTKKLVKILKGGHLGHVGCISLLDSGVLYSGGSDSQILEWC